MNPLQAVEYQKDPHHGLDDLLFEMLASADGQLEEHRIEISDLFFELKSEVVDVLTLEQGTADWHKGRQFSLSSSQTDGAFRKAFIIYQERESWRTIARYLFGENYYRGEFRN